MFDEKKFLEAASKGNNDFINEILSGKSTTQIKELVNSKVAIERSRADTKIKTPLYAAASKGHTDTIKLLLSHDADPKQKKEVQERGPNGYSHECGEKKQIRTPAQVARRNWHRSAADILEKAESQNVLGR